MLSVGALFFGTWLFPLTRAKAEVRVSSPRDIAMRVLVDAILPADEHTPAASTLEIHTKILNDAKHDVAFQQLIDDGFHWLKQSIDSLTELDSNQLEQLLQAMSDANWDSGPKNFFYQIRDRAVMYYYADPRAWVGSAINRPPQPLGYPEAITFK